MDGQQFDRFAQALAAGTSRRAVLKGLIGTALAAGVGALLPHRSDAAACRASSDICTADNQCCTGYCAPKDRTGRRRCGCPSNLVECKGTCVAPAAFLADTANCGSCGKACPRTTCQAAICANGVCGLAPDAAAVGKPCDDGKAWTTGDVCQANGTCAGTVTPCDPPTQCQQAGVRDPNTGVCVYPPKQDGTGCDDGNACTQTDTCQSGICVGGDQVVCPTADQCHETRVCEPATGMCSNPPKPNNTTCNADNDACTDDVCVDGECVAGEPLDCSATGDDCNDGVCDTATGRCTLVPTSDGGSCEDGDLCTQAGICQAGTCVGSNPTVCPPPGPCEEAGVCNPLTGECSYAVKSNGSVCDAGNCTSDGTCQAGECIGVTLVCPPPGQCQQGDGVCNQSTGVCEYENQPDYVTACDDMNACSHQSGCIAGVCTSFGQVTCGAPPSSCHEGPGTCNPNTGQCEFALKANGSPCSSGAACTANETCQAGVCGGGSPRVCAPTDDCHVAGVCDPEIGCSNPRAANGAPCDDGSPLCQNGACCADCCYIRDNPSDAATGGWQRCSSGQTCIPITPEGAGQETGPDNPGICCTSSDALCTVMDFANSRLDVICCASGQACAPVDLSFLPSGLNPGISVGYCCAEGTAACADFNPAGGAGQFISFTCCAADEACGVTDAGGGYQTGVCGEVDYCTGIKVEGGVPTIDRVVCDAGETCIQVDYSEVGLTGTYGVCCPSGSDIACPAVSYGSGNMSIDAICCASGTDCNVIGLGGPVYASVCCPSGEEPCVVGGAGGIEAVCCESGSECIQVNDSSTGVAGVCCPSGSGEACTVRTGDSQNPYELVCCDSGAECKQPGGDLSHLLGSICCANDACAAVDAEFNVGTVCCGPQEHCSVDDSGPVDLALCCPEGEEAMIDLIFRTVQCCAEPCTVNLGGTPIKTCCESGSVCVPSSGINGIPTGGGMCCPSGQEACLTEGFGSGGPEAPICCDNCQSASSSGQEFSICCPEGEAPRLYGGVFMCAAEDVCALNMGMIPLVCAENQTCHTYQTGPFEYGACCADGETFYPQTLTGPACCTEERMCDGFMCCPVGSTCSGSSCVWDQSVCPLTVDGTSAPAPCPEGTTCSITIALSNPLTPRGRCCPPGQTHVMSVDGATSECCAQDRACWTVDGNEIAVVCCAEGTVCGDNACVPE